MKTFYHMYKFIFKAMPKVSFGFLVVLIATTVYKVFFLEPGYNLFSMENITIDQIIFRTLFSLFLVGSYSYLFGFMREMINMPIFQLIPKIRTKAIVSGFCNIFVIYIWAVMILGFSNPMLLLFFTMLNLWFLSFCMSIYFFDIISPYRSNKYWFPKLFFFLFSISGPLVTLKDPMKRPVLYIVIISIFLIVVLYQIINFLHNYINLNYKTDITKSRLDSLQNFLVSLTVGSYSSTINELKKIKLNRRYFKLFDITLFGPITTFIWIFIGIISSMAYINIIHEWSIKTVFISIIGYFGFLAINNTSRYFKQKDKIGFLFINSGLSRSQFELIILKVTITRYFTRFLKTIPSILLIILGNNILFEPVAIYPLITCAMIMVSLNLIAIYLFWNSIMKNKDYDTIKKARVIRT
ncbi:MAG: hypothetical protein KAH33_04625 [Candidatus Delongbacteria bacterium]|nr:hypothetical protein [Candidatus Delongbacteria bacterium]